MLKFLNVKPDIFAIDINDLALRVVKMEKNRKGFALASFNDVDIPKGVVKDGIIQDEASLSKIIDKAYKTVKGKPLDTKYVVVSLPEEKSFAQVIQMPKMTEEELRLAVPFEAENHIPLPIDRVYLDFQKIDSKEPHHLDLLINVMAKPIIDSYLSCFKRIGLVPCILEVESQSIVRIFAQDDIKEVPTMFVDFGETKTLLIIYADHAIRFTVTVSIASQNITKSISQMLKIGFKESEELKKRFGLENAVGKSGSNIQLAAKPILDSLVFQIKKYLDFYRGHSSHDYLHSGGNVEKVVLCGGGSNLKGLPDFLSKELKIPVDLGNPFLHVNRSKKAAFAEGRALSFATAMGAALRGAGDTYLNSYDDNA